VRVNQHTTMKYNYRLIRLVRRDDVRAKRNAACYATMPMSHKLARGHCAFEEPRTAAFYIVQSDIR